MWKSVRNVLSSSLGLSRRTLASLGWETVGGHVSTHPEWTRFSTRRVAANGNSIPAIRSHHLALNIRRVLHMYSTLF